MRRTIYVVLVLGLLAFTMWLLVTRDSDDETSDYVSRATWQGPGPWPFTIDGGLVMEMPASHAWLVTSDSMYPLNGHAIRYAQVNGPDCFMGAHCYDSAQTIAVADVTLVRKHVLGW